MTERIQVAVEAAGRTITAGVLYVDTGRTLTSTFQYSPTYLASPDGYQLDPSLPLDGGAHHTSGLPGAFADATPDRWGRNLIRRRLLRERGAVGRLPTDLDFLLGVSDQSRQGALRFARQVDGPYLSDQSDTPKLLQLPRLLRAADRFTRSAETDEDIKTLLDAGSGSLGGARPKASVMDDDVLQLAKFPHHQDQWDVLAWEATALDLARRAGIAVPEHRLLRLEEGAVLLLRRFDRNGQRRIGYLSAMSLLRARDGDTRDYLDIAEEVSLTSSNPAVDLAELWTRAAFNVAINNTDDHLRNHGLLRHRAGWTLAPAFDLNPNPEPAPRQTSIGGETSREGCAAALLAYADHFRLSTGEASRILGRIRRTVADWSQVAVENGIPKSAQPAMEPAFTGGMA